MIKIEIIEGYILGNDMVCSSPKVRECHVSSKTKNKNTEAKGGSGKKKTSLGDKAQLLSWFRLLTGLRFTFS